MKNANWYLEKYGESHQNPTNVLIHKIFVPLIMFSVIGLLWAIPVVENGPWFINLGVALVAVSLIFYSTIKNQIHLKNVQLKLKVVKDSILRKTNDINKKLKGLKEQI